MLPCGGSTQICADLHRYLVQICANLGRAVQPCADLQRAAQIGEELRICRQIRQI